MDDESWDLQSWKFLWKIYLNLPFTIECSKWLKNWPKPTYLGHMIMLDFFSYFQGFSELYWSAWQSWKGDVDCQFWFELIWKKYFVYKTFEWSNMLRGDWIIRHFSTGTCTAVRRKEYLMTPVSGYINGVNRMFGWFWGSLPAIKVLSPDMSWTRI